MAEPEPVGEMTVAGLRLRFDEGTPLVLLDVREDHERGHARIGTPQGVADIHIPLGQVPARADEVAAAVAAGGGPLVVYCHHGQRSMVAATWLGRRGIGEVHNLDGGIDAWSIRVDRSVPRY